MLSLRHGLESAGDTVGMVEAGMTSFGVWSLVDWLVAGLAGFLVLTWAWLMAFAVADLLRRPDLSIGARAVWLALLLGLPFAGSLLYVAREGAGMAARRRAPSDELRLALRHMATSASDELVKLEALRARDAISPAEYNRLRSRILE